MTPSLRAIWCGFVSYFLFALAYIMVTIDIEPEVQIENNETARAECAREGEKGGGIGVRACVFVCVVEEKETG